MEKPINKECAATMETKQTTSGSNLVKAPAGASEEHTAAAMTTMEAQQTTQQRVQEYIRHQHTSPGKISFQPQNRDTAICFNRSELKLSGTSLTRPPPEPTPAAEEGTAEPDPDI